MGKITVNCFGEASVLCLRMGLIQRVCRSRLSPFCVEDGQLAYGRLKIPRLQYADLISTTGGFGRRKDGFDVDNSTREGHLHICAKFNGSKQKT